MNKEEEIIKIVQEIRKYNYWYFKELIDYDFYKIIEDNKLIFPKKYKSEFEREYFLKKLKIKLTEIENIIENINFDLLSFIIENIFENDKNINIKILNKTVELHFEIAIILFKYIIKIEQKIKNKMIWYLKKNNKHLKNVLNEIIEEIKSNNENNDNSIELNLNYKRMKRLEYLIEISNNENNKLKKYDDKNEYLNKFDSLLINEFSISDIILFFETIKNKKFKKHFEITTFLKELFGEKRFDSLYNHNKEINGNWNNWNVVPLFIEWLKTLNKIRNKVMHNKNLFDGEEKYSIKKGIQSIINLSEQKNNLGNRLFVELSIKTYSYLNEIKIEKAYEYFEEKFLKIGISNYNN